ncbi:predicted protein [Phaeodactylum tricornutum CCAP 1055/1]|jgi:hypothetical protein|uniref:Uncharacterized protein n=1 Tax=Phaeodactylum tricornutum (strain CCAP 1055/1) TaxID=556484 RepID=B7G7A7_PHATC|nr:predicted protein [Phaeodactylum tricornutum CCAP 1055/1]EEC45733.1 predicted protein [Phaeodactylum tricornutum CCAP 1055/1]|eukprot:XP_002182997.1 predicted protein [Phaeodactylum tricornutum CCAP 1055/1]
MARTATGSNVVTLSSSNPRCGSNSDAAAEATDNAIVFTVQNPSRCHRHHRRRPWRVWGVGVLAIVWASASHALVPPTRRAVTAGRTEAPTGRGLGFGHYSLLSSSSTTSTTATCLDMSSSSGGSENQSPTEFELHVGKALDTLRNDYPKILTDQPDFSIYHKDIEVVDPSGVKVHGINTYKGSFRLLHALVAFIYCPSRSGLTFRLCYDKARQAIRIHWNAQVVPREIFGGSRTTLYVDGISVYEMNRDGDIVAHRIEQLLMNNTPVQPKEGVIAALRQEHGVSVPSFIQNMDSRSGNHNNNNNQLVPFQTVNPWERHREPQLFSLSAMEATSNENPPTDNGNNNANELLHAQYPDLDWPALEAKNKSRKKFGLKPLTPEEFLALATEIQKMDAEQQVAAQMQRQQRQEAAAAKEKDKNSLFNKLFGGLLEDTCESNYDCERPLVCCDFGFVQKCCSSGSRVVDLRGQLALIPVPADVGYGPGDLDRNPPRNF